MKPKLLLRLAAIVMTLHLLGHSFGHLTWRKTTEPLKQQVINEMNDHAFYFMGAQHSMGDYYEGYGWLSSIAMILIILLFWLLSSFKEWEGLVVKKVVLVLSLCLLAMGVVEFVFFFAFAAAFSFLAAILSLVAFLQINRKKLTTPA